jgi:hypothetical protein
MLGMGLAFAGAFSCVCACAARPANDDTRIVAIIKFFLISILISAGKGLNRCLIFLRGLKRVLKKA